MAADYIQDAGKDLARQATATYSSPLDTSKFMGSQFVAGQDPAQTQAYNLATAGVGSYQPYLTAATAAQQQAAGTVGGLGALTGPMTGAQQSAYMSPYQGQVIDETLRQYDLSREGGQQDIRDAAVASGNFGGGREGAMMGQYNADTLMNRAGLRANMLQQGLQNAQGRFDQNFLNQQNISRLQSGLGTAQMGLSNFARTGMGGDVQALGTLGGIQQSQQQAILNAQQQAAQTAAYEPYGRLGQYSDMITGLSGGVASPQYQTPGAGNPWQSAIGTAMGLGGLYGKIFN